MIDHSRQPAVRGRRCLKSGTFVAAALLLSGCTFWPASGNNGLIFTDVIRPVAVLDKRALATRTGEACAVGILGVLASGSSSVNRAKTSAGITEVHTVEERFTHYLAGAYTSYCTIVSGT